MSPLLKDVLLQTEKLSIGYRRRGVTINLAENLNLQLGAGQLIALLGNNGAGKSTLIRTLAGLQKPLVGNIQIIGKPLDHFTAEDKSQTLSVLLTDKVWGEALTVRALVALGRHPYTNSWGYLSSEDEALIDQALRDMGADNLSARLFSELSDGEKQRVLLARTVAQQTSILLLDEPLAYLDWPHKVEVLKRLKALSRSKNKAILFSAHDPELILKAVDQVWLLHANGQMQISAPDILEKDALFREQFRLDEVWEKG